MDQSLARGCSGCREVVNRSFFHTLPCQSSRGDLLHAGEGIWSHLSVGDSDSWGRATSQVTSGLLLLPLFAPTKSLHICGASVIEFVRFLWGHTWFSIRFWDLESVGALGAVSRGDTLIPSCGTVTSQRVVCFTRVLTVSVTCVSRPPLLSGTQGDSLAAIAVAVASEQSQQCGTAGSAAAHKNKSEMSLPFCVLTCPTASPEIRLSCFPLLLTCLSLAFLLVVRVQRISKYEYFQ